MTAPESNNSEYRYMKVAGVTGESENTAYSGWSELLSLSFGVINERTHGRQGPSKSSAGDIHCSGYVDKASTGIYQKCADGTNIPKVEFAFVKMGDGQWEYLRLTIEDVYVTSVQFGGKSDGGLPYVNYSFNYARATTEYKPQTAKGTPGGGTSATWDIKRNKP